MSRDEAYCRSVEGSFSRGWFHSFLVQIYTQAIASFDYADLNIWLYGKYCVASQYCNKRAFSYENWMVSNMQEARIVLCWKKLIWFILREAECKLINFS